MSTVLVIGASRGIGLEFVRQYRADWDRVIATARDAAGLARIEALGARAIALDVADPASMSGLAWQLEGEKIDIALYVAGTFSTAGATAPGPRVVAVRVLAPLVEPAMQLLKAVRAAWRPALWDLPATVPRTWAL